MVEISGGGGPRTSVIVQPVSRVAKANIASLARALIKMPPLTVLDEPCQGLDPFQTAFTLLLSDRYLALFDATLIFVSHCKQDFPSCITQTLNLDRGGIA